jgi:hypothetical protein
VRSTQGRIPWIYSLTLFCVFPWALDKSTLPKLFALVLITSILIIRNYSRVNSEKFMYCLIFWSVTVGVYLLFYGIDSANSILLGYTQRRNGMMSILLLILVLLYFRSLDNIYRLKTLSSSALLISFSIWISKFLPQVNILFSQYSYPLPDAINRNIVSLYLCLGLISSLSLLIQESRKGIVLIFQTLSTLSIGATAISLGDFQTFLYLGILFLVIILFIFNLHLKLLFFFFHSFVFIVPLFVLYLATGKMGLDRPSFRERQLLIELGFTTIKEKPFNFLRPDSTADTSVSKAYEAYSGELLDNLHNVWLEVALHLGWVFALFGISMLICVLSITFHGVVLSYKSQPSSSLRIALKVSMLIICFLSLFISILHPITIFGLAIMSSTLIEDFFAGLTVFKEKTLIGTYLVKAPKLFRFKKIADVRLRTARYIKSISISFLLAPCVFLIYNVGLQVQFHILESQMYRHESFSPDEIISLTNLSIQMNDREYLDYVGRQLTSVGNCTQLKKVIDQQIRIGFADGRLRKLESWYKLEC